MSEETSQNGPGPDDRQARLLGALESESPLLGELYSGIVYGLHCSHFPNQARVLAYQARELMDLAPREMPTYAMPLPTKPPSVADLRKRLDAQYKNLKRDLEHEPLEATQGQQRCREFLAFLEEWLLRAEEARPDYEKLMRWQLVQFEPSLAPLDSMMLEMAVRRWKHLKDTFNAVLHGDPSVGLAEVRERIAELEGLLLRRLRPRPFEDQANIDALVARSPDDLSEDEVSALLDVIAALSVNYRYFFQHLESPKWLHFLEEKGFFQDPPGLVQVDEQTLAMDWPALLYLERIAAQAPDDVGRIARRISHARSSNPRVHEVLIRIGAQLIGVDSGHGGRLFASELDWVRDQAVLDFRLPTCLLAAATTAAKKVPGLALRASRALLSLEVSEKVREQRTKRSWHRLGDWGAHEILSQLVGELLPALPVSSQLPLLLQLCMFMETAEENEFETADPRLRDAVCLMWRPAIEDHEQNDLNSVVSWAIGAVRDAADALVPILGSHVLEALEQRGSGTLMRVSLWLRRRHADLDAAGTARLVGDPRIVGNEVLRHEVFVLLEERFGVLPEGTRKAYLEWVSGLESDNRKYLYLWPVRGSLAGRLLDDYDRYADTFGEIEHPDLTVSHGSGWVGPTSPISISEMLSLEIPDLVKALNSWTFAPGTWHGPEPEGLARELAAFAARDAARVSMGAPDLVYLKEPTCARGIVQGLANAVEKGILISWEPVLRFCRWAVEQERGEDPEGSGMDEFDRTWGPARKEIARLLEHGTHATAAEVPYAFRSQVWDLLTILVCDLNPTADEEAERAEYEDPATIAINTTRGVALGSVFSYALWVSRHNPQEKRSWASHGLDDLRVVLESLLASDSSPAVRSLFGKWLWYVSWLDQEWTSLNVGRIAPLDSPRIWAAVWESYMLFSSRVAPGLLDLLRPSYEHAVQNLPGTRPDSELPPSVDEALGSHLLLFYRHGFIDLGDDLVTRFFARADHSLRYSVMVDAVRGLQQVEPEEVGQVVDRLCSLWVWRYDVSVGAERERHHELSSFSWWFLKDAFDTAWRLQQLCQLQKAGIVLELDGPVLEKLDALAGEHLPEALSCLEAILHNRRNDRWGIYDDHVRALLHKALASRDAEVREQAESLVQYVGSLGFPSFRDLLHDARSNNPSGEGDSR